MKVRKIFRLPVAAAMHNDELDASAKTTPGVLHGIKHTLAIEEP
jgi:hypothetical protein